MLFCELDEIRYRFASVKFEKPNSSLNSKYANYAYFSFWFVDEYIFLGRYTWAMKSVGGESVGGGGGGGWQQRQKVELNPNRDRRIV